MEYPACRGALQISRMPREIFPEVPPRVEYELTPLGKSLLDPMQHLVNWVVQNWKDIKKAREKFEQKSNGKGG